MKNPNVCVLKADGINCDEETAFAFKSAGGNPEVVHVNQLRSGERQLQNYGVLAIPGGFSYGDDIASGKVLAGELTAYLSDKLQNFLERDRALIGICNGFQVLVRTGILPNMTLGEQQATLTKNDSGHFECDWLTLSVGASVCKFIQPEDVDHEPVPMQTAHGEGKFVAQPETLQALAINNQIVFSYCKPDGSAAYKEHPYNPNGSALDIAGITSPDGKAVGLMPHPERSIQAFHPNRELTMASRRAAQTLFKNMVSL